MAARFCRYLARIVDLAKAGSPPSLIPRLWGHWIGLGYISGGHAAWAGKPVIATDPVRKGDVEVKIVSPHMYDPKGERMYG